MSMRGWSQNGYGFDGDVLDKFSTEAKVAFMKKHLPDLYEDKAANFESVEDWEDYFNFSCMEDFNSDSSGFGNILAEVLREEEDLNVDFCTGENNYGTLMLNECLPWLMSSRMKSLTKEKFEDIVHRYINELKELDNKEIEISFDYESVEYYG